MLYLYFRPQREPLDTIEVLLSVMPYFVIEYVTECHDRSCSITLFIKDQLNYFHIVT